MISASAGPCLRLAVTGLGTLPWMVRALRPYNDLPLEQRPSILVAVPYLPTFDALRAEGVCGWSDWVLDSGAFSVQSGVAKISVQQYIEIARERLTSPDPPSEVFALDVVSDPMRGLRNYEQIWEAGIAAVPTFHSGDPEWILHQLNRDFPKLAIAGGEQNGRKGVRNRVAWAKEVFATVWPKLIHGFGFGPAYVKELPWHSLDSSNWIQGPACWRRWGAYQSAHVPIPSMIALEHGLRVEADAHQRQEADARGYWAGVLEPVHRAAVAQARTWHTDRPWRNRVEVPA